MPARALRHRQVTAEVAARPVDAARVEGVKAAAGHEHTAVPAADVRRSRPSRRRVPIHREEPTWKLTNSPGRASTSSGTPAPAVDPALGRSPVMRMGWARSSGKSRKASPGCCSRRARVSAAVAITSIGVKASKASLDWISTTRATGSAFHAPPASPSRVSVVPRQPLGVRPVHRLRVFDRGVVASPRHQERQVVDVVVAGCRLRLEDEVARLARDRRARDVGDASPGGRVDDDDLLRLGLRVPPAPRDMGQHGIGRRLDPHDGAVVAVGEAVPLPRPTRRLRLAPECRQRAQDQTRTPSPAAAAPFPSRPPGVRRFYRLRARLSARGAGAPPTSSAPGAAAVAPPRPGCRASGGSRSGRPGRRRTR